MDIKYVENDYKIDFENKNYKVTNLNINEISDNKIICNEKENSDNNTILNSKENNENNTILNSVEDNKNNKKENIDLEKLKELENIEDFIIINELVDNHNNCIINYNERIPEKFDSQIKLENLLKYNEKEKNPEENIYKHKNNVFEDKKYYLQVKIHRNKKFLFINKFIFLIKGEIKIENKKYEINITRSFSDFFLLNSILLEKFYYKVLPKFPEKNFCLKFVKNEKILEKRKNDLEYYLNYLIDKKEVLKSKILFNFFFNTNFDSNKKIEFSINEIQYKIKKKFSFQLINNLENSKKFLNLHSEIDFLDFFLNQLIYKLSCYKNNRIDLYKALNNFFSNSNNYNREKMYLSLSSIYVNKKTESYEYNKEFNHFIPFLEIIHNLIKNCKEALERQIAIYSDYEKLFILKKNDDSNTLAVMVNKNLEKKSKIDRFLKKDLENEIKKIHLKLSDFLNSNFHGFFEELFYENK